MKYTIYEDPLTRKFALLPLPSRFVDGDTLPVVTSDRWFDSHEQAVAAVPDLLNREEREPAAEPDVTTPIQDT
jgi:hypothetical protein